MNIICFGQQNWDYCWTGKQQLMTRLAQRGHRVLYIDPDIVIDVQNHQDHLRALAPEISRFGIREVGPGTLYVYTYHYAPAIRWRLNCLRHDLAIANVASMLQFHNPVVMSMRPDAGKRIRSVHPQAVLYQAIDEWTGFGQFESDRAEAGRIRAQEEDLIRSCEIAFGVSPVLQARMEKVNPRTYLLESGADIDHFAPGRLARASGHPGIKDLPHPRLGFVGQVDARLDQDLLIHVARSRPNWTIILAGRQHADVDFSAIADEQNIHLLGYQPYDQLPNVVREFDVCLVPYKSTNLTNSCSPLKVFEYLATGKPVVSTPLRGLGSSRDAVVIADNPGDFVHSVEAALANPDVGRERRLAVAAENSWHRRVDFLERCMEEAVELARQRGNRNTSPRAINPSQLPESFDRLHEHGLEIRNSLFPSAGARLAFYARNAAGIISHAGRRLGSALIGKRPANGVKLLVARRGRVSDLIATVPMIAALRKHLPKAKIVLGVEDDGPALQLLSESQDIDEIREISSPADAAGFDVLFSGGSSSILPDALYSGAPKRIGIYSGLPVQRLNTDILLADRSRHEGIDYLESAGLLTGADHSQFFPTLPWTRGQAIQSAQDFLRSLGIPDGATLVVVHPGALRQSRRWPVEYFSRVVNRILTDYPDTWIALTRTEGEPPILLDIAEDGCRRVVDAAADFRTTLGVVARAAAVVASDSDVMHLARTIGTPLIAVLGPENDNRWGPWRTGSGPAVSLRNIVPCAPCARDACNVHYCMRSVRPEQVLSELNALLAGETSRQAASPLVRKHTHMNWDAIAHAGFAIPRVSVLVLQDGTQELVGSHTESISLEDMLSDVYLQTYPNIEARIVRTIHAGHNGDPRDVQVNANSAAEAWRTILDAVSGEFLAPMIPEVRWVPDTIAAHIAVLTRRPEAVASYPSRATRNPSLLVVRRSAVEELMTRGEFSFATLVSQGKVVPADVSLPLLLRK